jgi:hypothetical protein
MQSMTRGVPHALSLDVNKSNAQSQCFLVRPHSLALGRLIVVRPWTEASLSCLLFGFNEPLSNNVSFKVLPPTASSKGRN